MASVLLMAFPGTDIYVSKFFYDGGFHLNERWWQKLLHGSTPWFLSLSMALVVAVYACNRWSKKNFCRIDGRKVAYLFLVLILGAGLIVNVVLKDNFGRARPRDVVEFGGAKLFTPAFVVSRECNNNCSFSSGEGAAGFFSLALATALSRRRSIYLAGLAIGTVVSFSRIAAGAHFFSDTVVSFFVMLVVADALYYYMFFSGAERVDVPAPEVAYAAKTIR